MTDFVLQNTGWHLAVSYDRKTVADENHPLHFAFLEALRDPGLDRTARAGRWRAIAFATRLPSDDLDADFTREDIYTAVERALVRHDRETAAALCVAGRIRFPDDVDLLHIEADALEVLGFGELADYRSAMADPLERVSPQGSRRAADRIAI